MKTGGGSMGKTKNSLMLALMFAFVFSSSSFGVAWSGKKYKNAEAVAKAVKITDDSFKKEKLYEFPAMNYDIVDKKEKLQYLPDYKSPGLVACPYLYQISAIVKAGTEEKTFKLDFSFYCYDTEVFFVKEIYDGDGNKIYEGPSNYDDAWKNHDMRNTYMIVGVAKMDRHAFDASSNITLEYLQAHKDTGLIFKIFTNKKDQYLHIPSYYIQAVVDAFK